MRVWQVVDESTSPMVKSMRRVIRTDLTLPEADALAKAHTSWKIRPIFEFD